METFTVTFTRDEAHAALAGLTRESDFQLRVAINNRHDGNAERLAEAEASRAAAMTAHIAIRDALFADTPA